MGFNISGIVIDKNLEGKIEKIENSFDWNLQKEEDIYFEEAMENWKEDGICDIYFSKTATLIFVDMETIQDEYKMEDANVLSFVISETSMAFYLNYYENNELRRKIMDMNGEIVSEYGDPLDLEDQYQETDELIWAMIESLLGKSFFKIQNDEPAVRYLME